MRNSTEETLESISDYMAYNEVNNNVNKKNNQKK